MDVTNNRPRWRRLVQFRLRSLLLFAFCCWLAVVIVPSIWRWAVPPAAQSTAPRYDMGGIRYFAPDPEFTLSREAVQMKAAQDESEVSRPTAHTR